VFSAGKEASVRRLTRRAFVSGALCTSAAWALGQPPELRQQIGGEWCVVKFPGERMNHEAVLILHGAGEWVNGTTSSWESQPGASHLIEKLLAAGYIVAQSNSAARNGNGMWGNGETQKTTAEFSDWLHSRYRLRKLHAVAVSAGNLVLLNLLLSRRARFASAVMLAPCVSIASEYRCPGGVNRVKTIAEAYDFAAASGCPGDPAHDEAFLRGTADYDPLRRLQSLRSTQVAWIFGDTRLLAIYESRDPRVPPAENILPFSALLQSAHVPITITRMEADTHGSQELFLRYTEQIVAFL
jgi:alpha-beta hydrolase superfamily lysophospholipase